MRAGFSGSWFILNPEENDEQPYNQSNQEALDRAAKNPRDKGKESSISKAGASWANHCCSQGQESCCAEETFTLKEDEAAFGCQKSYSSSEQEAVDQEAVDKEESSQGTG